MKRIPAVLWKAIKHPVLLCFAVLLAIVLCTLLWKQFIYIEGNYAPAEDTSENFRVALSLSPFSLPQFEQGYSFRIGDQTASTPEQLQTLYREGAVLYALPAPGLWGALAGKESVAV